MMTLSQKAESFQKLHSEGIFVMPNAWDAGSARVLAGNGFSSLGTTSAGIAFAAGLPDHQKLSRDEMLKQIEKIVRSVDVPVSADLEGGYGISPATVAETIRLAIGIGVVGCNLEDLSGDAKNPLLERSLAIDRIAAARSAADENGIPFILTARTDAYLVKHPNMFEESVARCNDFRKAGADCLFIPGISDADTIRKLVDAIDGPMTVVMGLSQSNLNVQQLKNLGVRRVSIGGSLARSAFGLIRRAAKEIQETGTFEFAANQYPHGELCDFFESWENRTH